MKWRNSKAEKHAHANPNLLTSIPLLIKLCAFPSKTQWFFLCVTEKKTVCRLLSHPQAFFASFINLNYTTYIYILLLLLLYQLYIYIPSNPFHLAYRSIVLYQLSYFLIDLSSLWNRINSPEKIIYQKTQLLLRHGHPWNNGKTRGYFSRVRTQLFNHIIFKRSLISTYF